MNNAYTPITNNSTPQIPPKSSAVIFYLFMNKTSTRRCGKNKTLTLCIKNNPYAVKNFAVPDAFI